MQAKVTVMSLRLATFNVENLMNRFDFSGYRNQLNEDRTLALFDIQSEAEYKMLEQARAIAQSDDTRQLTALAIAATRADIICMQEVDNIEALKAFEYGYLFKMVGQGYRQKYTTAGNDLRGIDVAVMMRNETAQGQPIEFVRMTSHAYVTFEQFGLHTPELAALGNQANERIFRRDCLEVDVTVGGVPLTLYLVHFKSMGSPRNGLDGREATMPVRIAEAQAVRRIIEERFGEDHAADKRWAICGDMNDYRQRVKIAGDACRRLSLRGGRREPVLPQRADRRRLLRKRRRAAAGDGPLELLSHARTGRAASVPARLHPAVEGAGGKNATAVPDIIRNGQPWRTIFPPGQEVDRFPRAGWDRPKASDHCPVAITLDMA